MLKYIGRKELICIFKAVDIEDKEIITQYLKKGYHEACEYSFTTIFMWQYYYHTKYYRGDDYIVLLGEYEDESFTVMPLSDKANMKMAFEFIYDYFDGKGLEFSVRAATKEFADFLEEYYPGKFLIKEERDYFDYVYDAEKLRTLSGRKYSKKKNHYNHFEKTYSGRYEYKRLTPNDFNECIEFLKKWSIQKGETDDTLENEIVAIKKLLGNYDRLDVKVGGIFIDGILEAFSIGDRVNEDMAIVHVEKANSDVRGLYSAINRLFLLNEFPDVKYVNREEDIGIEGLRKAKLSYNPIRFVEKYSVLEK